MSAFPLSLVCWGMQPHLPSLACTRRALEHTDKDTLTYTHTHSHTLMHMGQHEQAYIKDTSVSSACLMGQAGSGWPLLQVTAQISMHD